MTRGHAERLMPLVDAALTRAAWSVRDLEAVVVCTGPGGFTGARLGVAAARGLALALGRPAIGVDWFATLAGDARARVALPGPQGVFWLQRFAGGMALGPVETVAADDPALRLRPGEIALGEPERAAAGASALAAAGMRALRAGGAPRPAPLYLRPPDARPAAAQ